ncbi:cytochrome P460 family protein [Oceanomicrobium pacificus]|uniref:Cytochrome P460 domain-containing protein n=1 Tax=Oceanomicrobium pacificus TaxID=2692916 RepID=A0A6B0TZP9_9RHOB|nr:cytochrome P460 family protein [Oceanomicrobium pacificus]MXU66878.1 hypothetical protein [Oceanomicrobium pacificus]
MPIHPSRATALVLAACLAVPTTSAKAQSPAYGLPDDTALAAEIWAYLIANRLAGPDQIHAFPYEGLEPHGLVLETFYDRAEINGHRDALVIKRNYGPEGIGIEAVANDFEGHLGAITIMFRNAPGYDPDNGNWFYAKFLPDGTLDKAPDGTAQAGRVAAGEDTGCIACHAGAPGEDYIFTTDMYGR